MNQCRNIIEDLSELYEIKFEDYNPNPIAKESERTQDCVVRAITKAFDITWKDAYVYLSEIGLEIGGMPNCIESLIVAVEEHNWTLTNFCNADIRVIDVIRANPTGKYMITIKEHTFTVDNSCIYDTDIYKRREAIFEKVLIVYYPKES